MPRPPGRKRARTPPRRRSLRGEPRRAAPGLSAAEEAIRAAVTGRDPARAVAAAAPLLAPLPGLPPEEQLRIYREGWFGRLRSALAEDFPGLVAALGEDGFDALCADYLRERPSRHTDICRVGVDLPAYLAARAATPGGAFLADLARIEWSITSVFDRADAPVLRPAEIAGLSPEALAARRFPLAGTTDLLDLEHRALPWLEAVLEGGPPPPFPPAAPSTVVVARAGTAMARMEVPPSLAPALRALRDGAALGDALDRAAEAVPEGDAAALAALANAVRDAFGRWVAAGVFAGGAPAGEPGP